MATTGTYAWNPSLGSIGAYALGRCDVRRTAIMAEHLSDVAIAANLVLSGWSNSQPNLWTVKLTPVSLTQGNPGPYVLPADVVLVLDCYISTTAGDRVIYPVSRSEYAAFPIKTTQDPPTVYWLDRVVPPTLTVYPAPDGNGPYTLNYYAVHQDQDAALGASAGLDLPYRYFKAFSDALAAELAPTYAPDKVPMLGTLAAQSKTAADEQDREATPIFIVPALSGYYRR